MASPSRMFYDELEYFDDFDASDSEEDLEERQILSEMITEELAHGSTRLQPKAELIIPAGMTDDISSSIFEVAKSEPCGLKGCVAYFYLESDGKAEPTKLGKMAYDRYTVATFEVHITLTRERSQWSRLVPQFIKTISGNTNSIVLNKDYKMILKKLFRN